MVIDPLGQLLLQSSFFTLYAFSLVHKLARFPEFRGIVHSYLKAFRISSAVIISAVSYVAVGLEATALLACVAPVEAPVRVLAVAGPLMAYSIGMGANIAIGNRLLDCGCTWGSARQSVTPALVARNLLLIGVAHLLLLPSSARELGALDVLSIAFGTLVAALLYGSVNSLMAHSAADRNQ